MKTIYSAICPCCNYVCLSVRPIRLREGGESLDIGGPDMYGMHSFINPSAPNPATEQWLIEYPTPKAEQTSRRRRSNK